jgi:hypothetical protein
MAQLGQMGFALGDTDVAALRAEFASRQVARIPNLLDTTIVRIILKRIRDASWISRVHDGIGEELVLNDTVSIHALHFLFNISEFRSFVEEITECRPLRRFSGRIYKMNPGGEHYDHWHNDVVGNRLVGMSVNLGDGGFGGGEFLLREHASKRLLENVANTGLGDAIVFRISRLLDHRVNSISGQEPKIACAGWFVPDQVEFTSEVRAATSPISRRDS